MGGGFVKKGTKLNMRKIKKKILTHHEIIDCIPKKVVSVITQVYTESNLWIHL